MVYHEVHVPHGLSEPEFEEIMSRNRTVSSSAIALIKQSKVAHDDRCKILISSLQDTLHGIEAKSYGSGRKRSERSRSPRKHRGRERSRSREREYRDRSRS